MPVPERSLLKGNILYAASVYALMALSMVVEVIMLMTMNAGDSFLGQPYSTSYNTAMVLMEVLAIALPGAVFLLLRKGGGISMRLKFHPAALLAIPAAAAGYFFVIGVSSVWTGILTSMGLGQEAGASLPQNSGQLTASLFVVALSPALCEEFLFRSLIMPLYERHFRSSIAAIALSGLVFGLMHGQVSGAPGHIFLGLVIGGVVVATGSIWTGVLYHLTNNAVAMLLAYAATGGGAATVSPAEIPTSMMMLSGMLYMLVGGAVLAGLLAIFFAIYKKRQRERKLPQIPAAAPQTGFVPWLPLVIAAPVVVFRYGMSLLNMILSAAGLI